MFTVVYTVIALDSPARLPDILKARNCPAPHLLGMELDVLPVNLSQRYTGLWRDVAIQDCSPMVLDWNWMNSRLLPPARR